MSYIQNQGGYNNGYNSYKPPHSNLSYRNNNVTNPHDQVYPQLQQQPQSKPYVPFNNSFNQGFSQRQQFEPPIPSPPQPTPPPAVPDFPAMFQQLVQTLNNGVTVLEKHLVEIHTKMDSTLVDLQKQIESLGSKLRTMEGQVASTSAPQHISQLLGKATSLLGLLNEHMTRVTQSLFHLPICLNCHFQEELHRLKKGSSRNTR